MHSFVVTVGWFTRKKTSLRVRTRQSFAHGTTKIDESKCFNCQAGLKFYCFQAIPKFAFNIRF